MDYEIFDFELDSNSLAIDAGIVFESEMFELKDDGDLNEDVSSSGYNYLANAFRNGYAGALVLEVNGSEIHTTDLSSTLNAIATSNHSCDVTLLDINTYGKIEDNRGSKIYFLLSERHAEENLSNTQYFSDIDVKLLPNMLEAIQKYGNITYMSLSRVFSVIPEKRIKSVSIVYEVMRKWDKTFNLYESV